MIKNQKKSTLFCLVFLLANFVILAQTRTIKGLIKDSKTNEAIIGATVLVEGTTNGTTTDVNGAYSLQVDQNAKILVVSFVGMTTKKVEITGDAIDISLEPDAILLKETVITALGMSKEKKSLGYNVSEVKGEDLVRSGESNVIQGLASKASGIQVISSSGTPGASSKINIRGNATFTGENQPLIIVDGIPVDNTTYTSSADDDPFNGNLAGVSNSNRALDINPDDIESVTILKGPAAAALYGARAGTGAIIYTTKKGKYKKGLGVTYSTSVELQMVNKLPALQNKYAQGTGGGGGTPKYITSNPGADEIYGTDDDVSNGTSSSWGPDVASLGMTSHDNLKSFFKTGVTYNNNVSVDGGTDKTMYRFSFSNYKNDGIIPNTWMKRNTVRLNAEHKISEKLQVGTNISFANTRSQKPQNGSNLAGVMLGLLRMPTSYDVNNYQYANTGYNQTYFGLYDNPLYTVNKNPFNDNVNRVFGNTYINYKPLEWLDVRYKLGLDNYSDSRQQVYSVSSTGDDNSARYGQVNLDEIHSNQVYSDLIINLKKSYSETWNTSLTLGNNIWSSKFTDVFSRGRNMAVPNFYNLSNASERYTSNSSTAIRTYAGFFDGNIDYKGKVFLGVTGRNEWSSTFDKGKRSYFYPSVNTAIIISEFVHLPTWFSFAKVRAAYAQSGISPQPYQNRNNYAQNPLTDGFTNGNTFPFQGYVGYGLNNTLGSANLKPERVLGQEYGVDLRFFTGRLTLDVTYYNQKTVDILLQRPVAPSSGVMAEYNNSGQMQNKGWEIGIGANPVKTDNFSWDINITWYKNQSKVLKLIDGVNELNIESAFDGIYSYAIVGQPYGAFYGTTWQTNSAGKTIIDSLTGMPIQDPKNQYLGNSQPDWLSGIRNTFTYKNFSFTCLWDFRKGGKIWNGTKARINSLGRSKASEDREHEYTIEGVLSNGTVDANGYAIATDNPNTVPVSAYSYYRTYLGDPAYGGVSSTAIEDGSWVRLREAAFNYRIDMKKYSKYFQYFDLSISGRNLFLFTKYSGVDPETSLLGAGSNIQGFDYFNNPGTRSVFFGLKVGL